jgi:hypothetical protein
VSIASVVLVVGACTEGGSGSSDDAPAADIPVPSVTVPPARLTPFCQRMIDLDVTLAELAPDEPVGDVIVGAYRDALPIAPDEIAAEFAAVLRELETGVPATLPPGSVALPPITLPPGLVATTAPPSGSSPSSTNAPTPDSSVPASTIAPPAEGETFLEEGYLPDETPAQRVNAYIDFTCRNSQNNPGPPATPPGGLPIRTDTDGG